MGTLQLTYGGPFLRSWACFASFFSHKVDDIRADTAATPPPVITDTAPSSLPSFRPVTVSDVRLIIMSSPVKSCSLDPWPTFLICDYVDLLTPYVTSMVNISLSHGHLPESQNHAIVSPLLKKAGLDTADMANFRPVSNLTFLSKVVERVVALQLNDYLTATNLLPRCQSAYRRHHSMEIDMVRVLSDALTAADTRQVTLLGLLDMSAAFDCVDHSILLQRLERNFGISGLAIQWLTSFLTDRMQQVTYNRTLSKLQRLLYGLPQGLALGPLLFNLYTADIGMIVESHGLRLYQYTDNCQVYVSVLVTDAAAAVDQFLPVTCQCG